MSGPLTFFYLLLKHNEFLPEILEPRMTGT